MKIFRILMLTCALALCAISAHGWEINPNHHPDVLKRNLKTEYQLFLARLTKPTHETLTQYALQCAEARIKPAWCDLPASDLSLSTRFDEASLVIGSRWNDDPNNFFRVQREVVWLYWLKAAAHARTISDIDPLEYRSHYGDLQFLHAMGNASRNPAGTRDKIVEWAHFAYDVSTGVIPAEASLASLEHRYPFVAAFTHSSKRNWTVRKLFTNVGDVVCKGLCDDLKASDGEIASIAMGALLHSVQDSFSPSHVDRIGGDGPDQNQVMSWLDYTLQDAHCHGKADQDAESVSKVELSPKPPVSWGAWIIRNAMLKNAWSGPVEAGLREHVFKLNDAYRQSDGGKFVTCGKVAVADDVAL